MRDIEQKISPLVQSMFPSFYNEEGPNFIAFVKAYYEWLETNFQLLQLEDNTNIKIGDTVQQQDVTGVIINYVNDNILVQIDGFNTFKCYNVCSELIPITSSSGGSTYILTGGNTRRLNPLYMSRNLTKLRDIDKTLDLFVVNFKEKYLKNIEFDTSSNKQLLIKNSLDLYRSKGTERSIDLFFRLVYGIKASVTYPGERLFTLSAGEWYSPSYIEISSESVDRNIELVGKQIEGVTSGATAFVEKYIKRKISSGFVHLLYISNIRGEFIKNELLKSDVAFTDSPKVLGSLSSVQVISGGVDYEIGDVVSFTSTTGDKGLARVTSIKDKNGTVDFELLDGGWGFTVSANSISPYEPQERTQTLITDKLLTLANVETGNSISSISLIGGGSSYTSTDIVNIVSPTINATARIVTGGGGAITDVVLTNPGSGFFTTNTTIQILDSAGNLSGGSGAEFSLEFKEPNQYFRLLDNVDQIQSNTSGTLIYQDKIQYISLTSISGVLQVNDVIYQIGTYGESASARIIEIVSSGLASSQLKVDNVSGVFVPYRTVYVLGKSITAQFNSLSLVVGAAQISNSYIIGSNVYFRHSGTRGVLEQQTSGSQANYEVGSITNSETINLNTDLLSGNNVSDVPYLALPLSSFQFDFPKNTAANINDVIFSALTFKQFNVGTIATLADLNFGEKYTESPKTLTYQPFLLGGDSRDYILNIQNLSRSFAQDEIITQTYNIQSATLVLSSSPTVSIGEKIYSGTATGIVKTINESANSIIVTNVTGTITASQNLYSFSNSQLNMDIVTANQSAEEINAKAIVKQSTDTIIYAKRIQLENLFKPNISIVGSRSGATALLTSVSEDQTTNPIGLNADILGTADSTEGSISTLKIIDSGFGYQENQQLIFTSNTNVSTGTALARTEGVGQGIGYYKTSKGFLSSLSKLHDGDYYQEYSYEVLSRIPIDKYAAMFKRVMHTAGTKFFGSILIDSVIDSNTFVFSSVVTSVEGTSPYAIRDRYEIEVEDRADIQIEIRESVPVVPIGTTV